MRISRYHDKIYFLILLLKVTVSYYNPSPSCKASNTLAHIHTHSGPSIQSQPPQNLNTTRKTKKKPKKNSKTPSNKYNLPSQSLTSSHKSNSNPLKPNPSFLTSVIAKARTPDLHPQQKYHVSPVSTYAKTQSPKQYALALSKITFSTAFHIS